MAVIEVVGAGGVGGVGGVGEICGSRNDPWEPVEESTIDSDVDSDDSSDTRLDALVPWLCVASALPPKTLPLLL